SGESHHGKGPNRGGLDQSGSEQGNMSAADALADAMTALKERRYQDAEKRLAILHHLQPDDETIAFYLGFAQLQMGLPGKALPLIARAVAADGPLAQTVDAWVTLGSAAFQTGNLPPALAAHRKAVELAPDNAEAARTLGMVLLANREQSEALAELRRARDLAPTNGRCWFSLVGATALSEQEQRQLAALADKVAAESASAPDAPFVLFAHALSIEKASPVDRMDALHRANACVRADLPWSMEAERTIQTMALDHWDRTVDRFRPSLPMGTLHPQAIFVLGLPRSGTTLLERMLDAHPAVTGGGESVAMMRAIHGTGLDPWSKRLCRTARDRYWEAILSGHSDLGPEDLAGLTHVDKTPANYRFLGQIRLCLPNARVIHLTRRTEDTALSCYEQFFAPGLMAWSYDPADIGRYFALYEHQMNAWRDRIGPGYWFDLTYEDLVGAPKETMTRLLDFLGLPWDDAVMVHHRRPGTVITAGRAQIANAVHARSIGRAEGYETFTDCVHQARKAEMDRLAEPKTDSP
ncbi:MAG: sulfotransferase, partial [Rhodospirillaceae bacterium]